MTQEQNVGEKAVVVRGRKESALVPPSEKAEALISQAIAQGVPVETMERLLAMRRELKGEFAKEQFDNAMAKFQGDCPVIKKTKAGGKTKSGTVAYYYAPLDSIVSQTKDLIKKHGFSYAIQTQTGAGKVKVTCVVKHMAGHSESSDVEVPLGTKTDIMSDPQVVASALTFAKRYAFCNAFGILTGDDDSDGPKIPPKDSRQGPSSLFAKAVKMIAAETDKKVLTDWRTKVAANKEYSAKEKDELTNRINAKLGTTK